MSCTCNFSRVTIVKLSQRPFQQSSIKSRESITRNSNKSLSSLVSLTGIKYENQDAVSENQEVVKKVLDSCKDWESSVSLLLNSTVFWKKVALYWRKLRGAKRESILGMQRPSWIILSSKSCSEMSRGVNVCNFIPTEHTASRWIMTKTKQ